MDAFVGEKKTDNCVPNKCQRHWDWSFLHGKIVLFHKLDLFGFHLTFNNQISISTCPLWRLELLPIWHFLQNLCTQLYDSIMETSVVWNILHYNNKVLFSLGKGTRNMIFPQLRPGRYPKNREGKKCSPQHMLYTWSGVLRAYIYLLTLLEPGILVLLWLVGQICPHPL